jgi:hypothetical protein
MKKFVFVTLIITTILIMLVGCKTGQAEVIPAENVLTPLTFEENSTVNKEELTTLIEFFNQRQLDAHYLAESARCLGYAEEHPIIILAKQEWTNANAFVLIYSQRLDNIIAEEERIKQEEEIRKQKEAEAQRKAKEKENQKWSNKQAEYPEATYVWRFMKSKGWNDYVCAGIMGNMMAEVGGQTLALKPNLSGTYYGICQWSKSYGEVWGKDLAGQCEFLAKTIEYEFNTYGSKYQKGFKFNNFLQMTNEKEAALAFAKAYERCASKSYGVRKKNATKALNYFMN